MENLKTRQFTIKSDPKCKLCHLNSNQAKLGDGLDKSPNIMVGDNKTNQPIKIRGILKHSWAFVETKKMQNRFQILQVIEFFQVCNFRTSTNLSRRLRRWTSFVWVCLCLSRLVLGFLGFLGLFQLVCASLGFACPNRACLGLLVSVWSCLGFL